MTSKYYIVGAISSYKGGEDNIVIENLYFDTVEEARDGAENIPNDLFEAKYLSRAPRDVTLSHYEIWCEEADGERWHLEPEDLHPYDEEYADMEKARKMLGE